LANLGYKVCDQTVGNVLHRHALPPAPERKRTTTWSAFIRIHLALLVGTDFFTAEVLTLRGVPFGCNRLIVTYWISLPPRVRRASFRHSASSHSPLLVGMADFRRALEIKPLEWRALRELGNLWLGTGNAVAALEAYDAALRIEVRDADLQANAGLAASELGDAARAIRHSRTAIALNPKHVGAHNNLAAELTALGRPHDALPHARLAAEHGDDPDFWVNLATIERLCSEWNRSRGQGGAPTSH
jgi:hypothetical protein